MGGEVWRREGVGVRVGYIDGLIVRCIRSIRSRFRERVLRGRVEPGEETRRLPHCVGGRKRGQAAKNNMVGGSETCDNKRREREEGEVIGAAGGGQVARPGFGRREPSVSIPILFSAPSLAHLCPCHRLVARRRSVQVRAPSLREGFRGSSACPSASQLKRSRDRRCTRRHARDRDRDDDGGGDASLRVAVSGERRLLLLGGCRQNRPSRPSRCRIRRRTRRTVSACGRCSRLGRGSVSAGAGGTSLEGGLD